MSIKPRYISEDECREFQQQHPDLKRKEIFAQHWQYYQAMRRYDLLDTLYPLRKHAVKHTDEELIQAARKYQHVTDMAKSEKAALNAIYRRHLEDRAFRHMKPKGDRKHKFIYAYEFPDHAVYVGLTYDHNIRHAGHFDKRSNSAVRRHKEQTGQEPTYKQLTDLMPVEQAQQMEGHWEEQYRQQGWTILNVAKTGGLGGIPLKAIDPQKIVCLFQRGTPPAAIARQLGISIRTTYKILKQEGLSYRGMSAVTVEMTDEQGNIVLTFPSVQAAADHYGMHPANIRTSIKKGWRVRGLHIRYNQFEYEIKHRCRQLGEDFLTIFPQIDASVKDYTDPKTGQLVVATAEMLTANNAHSRLGCSVHKKFSAKFATEVQWQKVDANGNEISDDEEDITQGNDGPTPDPNEGGENEE